MGHLVTLIAGSSPCTVLVVGVLIRVCSDGVMLSWIEVHTFLLQTAVFLFFLSSVNFYVIVPSTCTAVVQLIEQGLL